MENNFFYAEEINIEALDCIKQALKNSKERTNIIGFRDKKYFVKKMRSLNLPISAFLVNSFFELFRTPFLKVSLKYGGRYSFQSEILFLSQLLKNQIQVPKLIHIDVDFLVLEFLDGKSVEELMGIDSQKWSIWLNVLNELKEFHKKGFCLSQAFSRNMMFVEGRIFFFDFEENPLDQMDINQAQARDWIFFLLSTVWRFASCNDLLPIWQKTISDQNETVISYIKLVSKKYAWLRFLPVNRRIWGRDIIQLQALGNFLFQWKASERH